MTDFRAMCAELVDSLENARRIIQRADGTLHINTAEFVLRRARALLAEPETEGPTDEELREMFNENDWNYISPETFEDIARTVLAQWGRPAAAPVPEPGEVEELVETLKGIAYWKLHGKPGEVPPVPFDIRQANRLTRAATLLQQQAAPVPEPEPVAPTDEEIEEWADACSEAPLEEMDPEVHGWRRCFTAKEFSETIRAAIARYGRPAAAPVPVSERLPGPEDCDADGRCWRYIDPEESMGNPMWELARSKYAGATYGSVAWLPANALPLPAPEGGESQP